MALTPALEQQILEEVSEKHFEEMVAAQTFEAQKKVIQKALKALDSYLKRYDSDTQVEIIAKATDYPVFTPSREVQREAMRELDQRREALLLLKGQEPEAKARVVQSQWSLTGVMKTAAGYFGGKTSPEEAFLKKQKKQDNRESEHHDRRTVDESKMPKMGGKKK